MFPKKVLELVKQKLVLVERASMYTTSAVTITSSLLFLFYIYICLRHVIAETVQSELQQFHA